MQTHAALQEKALSVTEDLRLPCSEELALLYLSCGNVNLLSEDDSSALDAYQKASDLLNQSNDCGLKFLTAFGKTIVCDRLNLTTDCTQYLSELRELLPISNEQLDSSLSEDCDETTLYLKDLAHLSPSQEIQRELLSFVSKISSFSSSHIQHLGELNAPSFEETLSAQKEKTLWKRMEKLCRNIRKACIKVLDIVERCLDIRDRLKTSSENNKTSTD